MASTEDAGIDLASLHRCIEEQIYTLPGTTAHREAFTVLLTGSRACGLHTPESDVDIDVLCPRAVCDAVTAASAAAGIAASDKSFFHCIAKDRRYFGHRTAHFSLTSLERVAEQIRGFDDVALWVWTNARIIADPAAQFAHALSQFRGYPPDVLVRKIKYRWLLTEFWAIDVYPHHHTRDDQLLPAATAIANAVNECLRLFFLLDGKPFPYAEWLPRLSRQTTLGERFAPMVERIADLVVGRGDRPGDVWSRLDEALGLLVCEDVSPESRELWQACGEAARAAGVEPPWIAADYNNIEELYTGALGPAP